MDSVRIFKETVDPASRYAFWLRMHHLFIRWSVFLFFVLLPVYMEAIKSYPRSFPVYWWIALAFVVISILWNILLNEFGRGLWFDLETTNKEELSRGTTIMILSSAILCCILLYWWIWLNNHHYIGDDISRFLRATELLNIVTLGLIAVLVVAYLTYRFKDRKPKPLRMRSKVIRRLVIHPRELVERALDALHLRYDQVRKGLNRRTLESLYEVQDHQVRVQIREKNLHAFIVTIAHSPEDISTAERIEKSIDVCLQSR